VSVQLKEEISGKADRIRKFRVELQSINNKKLLEGITTLDRRERKLKVIILLYLREVDRRSLYLELGYSSMFDFCTERLRYTRSSACRRIAAARCIGRYPRAAAMLYAGELNVSTLFLISKVINPGNCGDILNRIRGKSYREAEEELARRRPVRRRPEKIKTVFTIKPQKEEDKGSTPNVGSGEKSVDRTTEWKRSDKSKHRNMKVAKEYRLEFMVGEKTMKKIKKAKSLLSTKYPEGVKLEVLFDQLLENYLEENDPDRRTEKTGKNPEKNKIGTRKNTRNRYIPQEIKDEVYRRDGGRCSFVGKTGRRCNSTWNLQYDHIVPYGKGGDNTPDNLRLLCAKHNQLMAEKEYGRKHMDNFRGSEP